MKPTRPSLHAGTPRSDRVSSSSGLLRRVLFGSWAFNVAYLLLAVLVPLDAVRLGLASQTIGLLAAIPGVLQLPARILSGPLTDTWGERTVLLVTFGLAVLAGLSAMWWPAPVAGLILAQLAIGAARGLFWTAAQAYTSRLSGSRTANLGRFTSFAKGGALVGIAAAGPVATGLGMAPAFALTATLGLVSAALAWSLAPLARARSGRPLGEALRLLPGVARDPVIVFFGMVSMLCALPQALAQSFFPVWLLHLGASASEASLLTALQSLGMIAAGFVATGVMARLGPLRLVWLSGGLLALALFGVGLPSWELSAGGILAAGLAAGWLNVAFLTAVADTSTDADRGTRLGVTQIYFVVSMMATPVLSGVLAGPAGLSRAFAVEGLLVLALLAGLFALRGRLVPLRAPEAVDAPRQA
ncbi:MAG: MFS transporter [Actinomycetia bacterium]|nr:MFS transporter [Actinomycetes bacterium]